MATNILGPSIKVYLRIKEGKPDKNGLYNLVLAADESFDLSYKVEGCNLEGMAESIKNVNEILMET